MELRDWEKSEIRKAAFQLAANAGRSVTECEEAIYKAIKGFENSDKKPSADDFRASTREGERISHRKRSVL